MKKNVGEKVVNISNRAPLIKILRIKTAKVSSFPVTSFFTTEDFQDQYSAAIIVGSVYHENLLPLEGISVVLKETGAMSVTNSEGMYVILTQVTGQLHVSLNLPESTIPVNDCTIYIPSNHGGITIHVPDFVVPLAAVDDK